MYFFKNDLEKCRNHRIEREMQNRAFLLYVLIVSFSVHCGCVLGDRTLNIN